ncbi:NUDIX hydrolase [Clostridia bacterium]|nr:NUDIX hydrolase [Clostridia bacterium]
MNIVEQILTYQPYNKQEEQDQMVILDLLNKNSDLFHRSNLTAHMTASAWVVNQDFTKVLMVYHNIFDSWSWLGGHADGETNLHAVAESEVLEESGLTQICSLSKEIFSLEILTVDGHIKSGNYVASHLHLNVTYLFKANDQAAVTCKPDENSDVAWFDLNAAIEASSEPWFKKHIYPKLNHKLNSFILNSSF